MDRQKLFTFGLVGWICDPSSNPLKIPKNKIKKVEATQKIRHKCLKGYNDKSREQSTPIRGIKTTKKEDQLDLKSPSKPCITDLQAVTQHNEKQVIVSICH